MYGNKKQQQQLAFGFKSRCTTAISDNMDSNQDAFSGLSLLLQRL